MLRGYNNQVLVYVCVVLIYILYLKIAIEVFYYDLVFKDGCMEKIAEGFKGEKAIVIPYSVRDFQAENPLTENLFVTDIGYYPCAKFHFRGRSEGAAEHILIYCGEGQGWVSLADQKFHLSKNHAFIIPAHTSHIYAADRSSPWSIYWIHFRGTKTTYYQSIFGRVLKTGEEGVGKHQFRLELFESIFQNLESGYLQENLEYSSVCLQHLLASFMYTTQLNRISSDEHRDLVHRSIDYMKLHVEEKLSLEDIATSVNYSPNYFGILFKEKTTYSPIEYYNQLKIQRSCSLLQFTDLKIKEIAFRLGYYDAFHFSRAFLKEMGISPKEYRKRYQ